MPYTTTDSDPVPIMVRCDWCGDLHRAFYSHMGQWSSEPVYVATCGVWSDYYTAQATSVDHDGMADQ